jgi:outer membrane protein
MVSDTGYFYKLPELYGIADSQNNPLLALYNSNIELIKARKKVLNKTTMPTLGVWGTTYARGSGIDYHGKINSLEGLGFQRFNYGLGAQLSIPLLQSFRVNPQLKQQDYLIEANAEKFNELTLQLKKQNDMADAALQNAIAVAQESPLFYESANYSYRALLSRYQSGLANFADLVQAQYGLVKAEVERKTSYIEVWKSLLFKAAVNGDLNLFMNQIK